MLHEVRKKDSIVCLLSLATICIISAGSASMMNTVIVLVLVLVLLSLHSVSLLSLVNYLPI
jgi:hypothetical protein